jgi:YebC/PmpR family DNA-binding regulatory protein
LSRAIRACIILKYMSGHSHYSTIKRAKEANDQQRGKIFSKFAREIGIVVREGGGTDPAFNYKLRMVLDKAREANMPKDNIDRAITKSASGAALERILYEGFGPGNISVIVEAATDNKNRTSQEIKNLFERGGGKMAGTGAVSFNFENKGLLVIKKDQKPDEQMLKMIDLGVEDIDETSDGFEVYTQPEKLYEVKGELEKAGFTISSAELYMKPKMFQTVTDSDDAKKAIAFIDLLNDHDDVSNVFSNLDVPDNLL